MSNYTINITDSGIANVLADKTVNIKNLGQTTYTVNYPGGAGYVNKTFSGVLISDTGLFKEDIEYRFPFNPSTLQGSPGRIKYDTGTNNVYCTTFYGYYVYNTLNKVTQNIYITDGAFTDIAIGESKIYINNEFDNSVYVYNKSNNQQSSKIVGFDVPRRLLLDELNSKLYVASSKEFKIKIINTTNNLPTSGVIQFQSNEWVQNMKILNNKLYVVTDTTQEYRDVVIVSGINNINTTYNTYGGTAGYKRLRVLNPYGILAVPENNNVYISDVDGLKILNSTTDTFQGYISGHSQNIDIDPSLIQRLRDYPSGFIGGYDMVFNKNDNKIYSINRGISALFISNTGSKVCDKISSLSYITNSPQSLDFKNNKIYISAAENLSTYKNQHYFIIYGNRPKAQISFPAISPKYTNSSSFNLNVTSNNSVTPIIYKSSNPSVADVNSNGLISISGSGVCTIYAGQISNENFALSFNDRVLNVLPQSSSSSSSSFSLEKPQINLTTTLNPGSTVALNINWIAVTNATLYKFDISTCGNPSTPPNCCPTCAVGESDFSTFVGIYNNFSVNGFGYSVQGLASNTIYYVRVKAFGLNNIESPYSNTASISWSSV